jgi:hypothetical protein
MKDSKKEKRAGAGAGMLLRLPAHDTAPLWLWHSHRKKNTSKKRRTFAGGGRGLQKLSFRQQCSPRPPARPAKQ